MSQRRMAVFSFLCVAVAWLSFPLVAVLGANGPYPSPWWTATILYTWMFLTPTGVLLAIAALIFDTRKWTAGLALTLNLLTCLMILGIGG